MTQVEIRPQAGPQEAFLSTSADIAIYGGAAGGGKTFGLLMEPLRNIHVPRFEGVIFRRETPQIANPGGLWDTSTELYPFMGGKPRQQPYSWRFGAGSRIEFHHLQYESTVLSWQGAQLAFIGFDELTHFSRTQFFYMLTRNRSLCGVRPYVRSTCNPDPDSWVREFIDWWIDDDGNPIPERSGVIRYFIRHNDQVFWADNPDALREEFPGSEPKSCTFIAANIHDNPILLEKDPGYVANLKAQPRHVRAQLLDGNWNARPAAGVLFARSDFEIIDECPRLRTVVRYWDRAATEPSDKNPDPDWTAGCRMGVTYDGQYVITDVDRFRKREIEVRKRIRTVASQDGTQQLQVIEQDPGQAGKVEAADLVRFLAGYPVKRQPVSTKKYERWLPYAAQVQNGNVKLLRGAWNEPYIAEMIALTDNPKDYGHDDQGDASSGAFNELCGAGGKPSAGARTNQKVNVREVRW